MAPPRRTEQTLSSSAISRRPSTQAQGELAADICSTDPRRLSGTQASDPFLPGPGNLKSITPMAPASQPALPPAPLSLKSPERLGGLSREALRSQSRLGPIA